MPNRPFQGTRATKRLGVFRFRGVVPYDYPQLIPQCPVAGGFGGLQPPFRIPHPELAYKAT
jgi:hypothetical protein